MMNIIVTTSFMENPLNVSRLVFQCFVVLWILVSIERMTRVWKFLKLISHLLFTVLINCSWQRFAFKIWISSVIYQIWILFFFFHFATYHSYYYFNLWALGIVRDWSQEISKLKVCVINVWDSKCASLKFYWKMLHF